MAKIQLAEGFSLLPEGVTVFKITDVEYKEDFGKLVYTLQTQNGQKHLERFTLKDSTGKPNQGALGAFSYFAKTALNNYKTDEIDHDDLVGCFIKARVSHKEVESTKEKGKMLTFVELKDYAVAQGFETTDESQSTDVEDEDDLDSFLDD